MELVVGEAAVVALWLLSVTPGKVPWLGTVLRSVLLAWGMSRQGFGREPGARCRKVALSRTRVGLGLCDTWCFQAGKGDGVRYGLGRGFLVGSRHLLLRERAGSG